MFYKNNTKKELDKELFENPTAEYRGAPFWSWNCEVTKERISKQLAHFKEMGFGGVHIHARTGLETPYLSDEFLSLVSFSVEESKRQGTLTWLYDEDRCPSGFAGGLATKTKKYRQRLLLFTSKEQADIQDRKQAIETGGKYLVCVYDVLLNATGELVAYKPILASDEAKGEKWFAYSITPRESGKYNNQTYLDTLSKEAVNEFVNITHERYKKAVGKEFGKNIPAIFTDEPQFACFREFCNSLSGEDITMPWTLNMEEGYFAKYNERIEEKIPELFWEKQDGTLSATKYRYHDFVCELFVSSYADNIANWCEKNNVMLTGHLMDEDTLAMQTGTVGEAMRFYRSFQLPGIDMLCNERNYATAKQCQSVVHQYGKEGMLSELYGVTDWDFDFRGYKHQGDWQTALGVTVRVPHLAWMSMKGDAKRDFPAAISYQSPWYKEYSYIENHFARLNTALTRGKSIVDIAVIHPIESYWIQAGAVDKTQTKKDRMEKDFSNVIEWLLFSHLDFDFISESLLPTQYKGSENKKISVGEMQYKAVVVPNLKTIRKSTLEVLEGFQKAGGKVIFMGELPTHIDGEEREFPDFVKTNERISFARDALISSLKELQIIDIRDSDGWLASNCIYNYRQDKNCNWLFICHAQPSPLEGGFMGRYNPFEPLHIKVKGEFTPIVWDTLTGKTSPAEFEIKDGYTIVKYGLYSHDSLLLQLLPYGERAYNVCVENKKVEKEIYHWGLANYRLEESNVLLLDRAQFKVDSDGLTENGEWIQEEEILKIYQQATKVAGIPPYNGAQPWLTGKEKLSHFVDLKITIQSEIEYRGAFLAFENATLCEVVLNGEKVTTEMQGYFVDESIEKIPLPIIKKGKNVLLIRSPIGVRTKVEWCYLLGDFGVSLTGTQATICKLPKKLGFSTITAQKLPFYTGNIEYDQEIELEKESQVVVRASEYRGALIKVFVDGTETGIIAFSPYKLNIGKLKAGKHTITYKLFGNRFNAFGALHNNVVGDKWVAPNIWYTTGDKWCYEYKLRDLGILASPVVSILED